MQTIVERYNKAIEEIITINELKEWYEGLDKGSIKNIMNDIVLYYKVEMNFSDFE